MTDLLFSVDVWVCTQRESWTVRPFPNINSLTPSYIDSELLFFDGFNLKGVVLGVHRKRELWTIQPFPDVLSRSILYINNKLWFFHWYWAWESGNEVYNLREPLTIYPFPDINSLTSSYIDKTNLERLIIFCLLSQNLQLYLSLPELERQTILYIVNTSLGSMIIFSLHIELSTLHILCWYSKPNNVLDREYTEYTIRYNGK